MPDGSVVAGRDVRTAPHPGPARTAPPRRGRDRRAGPTAPPVGPDGAFYVCNNGGCFTPVDLGGLLVPGPFDPTRYIGGRIQRVDVRTGEVTDLYTECDGRPLRAPNDLVMDGHGGFWFTDHGIRDTHGARTSDLTGHLLRPLRRLGDPRGRLSRSRRPTASACRPTAPPCTGPRPTPGGCSSGRSPRRASWRRPCRSTRPACCAGCPGSSCSTRWPSTATAGSASPR